MKSIFEENSPKLSNWKSNWEGDYSQKWPKDSLKSFKVKWRKRTQLLRLNSTWPMWLVTWVIWYDSLVLWQSLLVISHDSKNNSIKFLFSPSSKNINIWLKKDDWHFQTSWIFQFLKLKSGFRLVMNLVASSCWILDSGESPLVTKSKNKSSLSPKFTYWQQFLLVTCDEQILFQNKRAKIKKISGVRNNLATQLMAQGLYNHCSNNG